MSSVVRGMLLGVTVAAVTLVCEPAHGGEARAAAPPGDEAPYDSPYVYQHTGAGVPTAVTPVYELGYGSRESRSFTQEGIEQALRLRVQPLSRLGLEAFGGVVLDGRSGAYRGSAASVEAIGRVLEQERHALDLDVGLGYLSDYRGDQIPRVRLTEVRSFGRLDLGLSELLEIPVGAAGRDELDVMGSAAASYGVRPWLRLGLEGGAEDLEGLFEPEEAEGGAKFLLGPTAAVVLPHDVFVKVNVASVYAYLANQRYAAAAPAPDEWGFLGRAVVGWSWR